MFNFLARKCLYGYQIINNGSNKRKQRTDADKTIITSNKR